VTNFNKYKDEAVRNLPRSFRQFHLFDKGRRHCRLRCLAEQGCWKLRDDPTQATILSLTLVLSIARERDCSCL